MFVDVLIPRLKAAGLIVHDIRSQLPRNGTWMTRPISAIKRIAHHYDAELRPHSYNSVERYKRQAQYHINKDWGGGARGDGIMYALIVDNVGDVFICRDFEHVTWHVGNPNYSALATKYDCGGDQAPTREQIEAMQRVADVLTTKCPEFPAGRAQYYGHQEFKQFGGTATACPGKFMPEVVRYRNTGKVDPTLYQYDWPKTPAPAPAPEPPPAPPKPEPTPAPAPEPAPEDPRDVEIRRLKTENERLINEVTDTAKLNEQLQETNKELTRRNEELLSNIESQRGTIERLENELATVTKERDDLKKQQAPKPAPQPTPEPKPGSRLVEWLLKLVISKRG